MACPSLETLNKEDALLPFFAEQENYWFEMKSHLNFILNSEQQLPVLTMPEYAYMVWRIKGKRFWFLIKA